MSHDKKKHNNKKRHKRIVRRRKTKERRKAQRASLYASATVGVVDDIAVKNAKRYEAVFSDEITPYIEYLEQHGVREVRTAIRVTNNPAEPSDFISKREISLAQMEKNQCEEYLYIPSKPAGIKQKQVLGFLGERGLSHYVNFEAAEKAMNKLYEKLVSSQGLEVAEGFFEQHGRYLVEMKYDEKAGYFLPTNSSGHFDLVREPTYDYKEYLTDNYREISIQWQNKD